MKVNDRLKKKIKQDAPPVARRRSKLAATIVLRNLLNQLKRIL